MKKHASLVLVSGMLLLSLGMILTACGGSSSSNGGTTATAVVVNCSSVTPSQSVSVGEYFFTPSTVNNMVTNGVIKWTNNGAMTHSVTSGTSGVPDGKIDSNLVVGQSVCLQFTTAGSFSYYCKYHPTQMSGSVTVQ